MSQASLPVGRRQYDEDRALVLQAVREIGPCTVEQVREHLADYRSAALMAAWHLVILGDRGLVRWSGERVELVA